MTNRQTSRRAPDFIHRLLVYSLYKLPVRCSSRTMHSTTSEVPEFLRSWTTAVRFEDSHKGPEPNVTESRCGAPMVP